MLKSIGSLHNVPAPSAAVLGESLKLLSTFGDKKAISALLEQVRDVQTINEQVFRDAQALMAELVTERNALDESRRAFAVGKTEEDREIKQRTIELSQAEARLSGKVAAFDAEQVKARTELGGKLKEVAERETAVSALERKYTQLMNDLNQRAADLDKREIDLGIREKQLQVKESKLRAYLEG